MSYIKALILWISVILLLTGVSAQAVFPPHGVVFNDQVVPRIDIRMSADSLMALTADENTMSDHEYPANFYWNDGQHFDTIFNVGIRLRGNTSRVSAKKSFKIKFNHFGSGKFYGLSDLNLNGEHNDPSIVRSKLSWDMMKMAGIEAPRSNHVALYINNEYRGLYINVEHIDNDYISDRNKDPEGQLFKCFYGCSFVNNGNNPNNYSRTVYHAENNEDNPDYYALMEFIQALNNTGSTDYRCQLEALFDVDDYIKRMAMEVLLGHWDNPIYNKNNAYLYRNTKTGKFELWSYDIDNTYGIDWFGVNWAERNIYTWAHPTDPRPIFNNLMNVPEYKVRYGYYIKQFIKDFFNPGYMFPYIENIKNRIKSYRINDTYAEKDYGYSYQDFLTSYENALGAHVKRGLKEYISIRSASANQQLQNTGIHPVIEQVTSSWTQSFYTLDFRVDASMPVTASCFYRPDNGMWTETQVKDDGIFPDRIAGDHRYTFQTNYSGKVNADVYLIAQDAANKQSRWPVCEYQNVQLGYDPVPQLVINEYMADNTTIRDDAGEYDDWIEIYNYGTVGVWLGDKYLTDNANKPVKWLLPDFELEPGAFLLIWADEDKIQGDLHANFKLSKSGEFIGIYDSKENNFAPIDTFSYGISVTDLSYGKYPDGKGPNIALFKATPGYSNVYTSTDVATLSKKSIYPNPAHQNLNIKNVETGDEMVLCDMAGKCIQMLNVREDKDQMTLDISALPKGMYLLVIRGTVDVEYYKVLVN